MERYRAQSPFLEIFRGMSTVSSLLPPCRFCFPGHVIVSASLIPSLSGCSRWAALSPVTPLYVRSGGELFYFIFPFFFPTLSHFDSTSEKDERSSFWVMCFCFLCVSASACCVPPFFVFVKRFRLISHNPRRPRDAAATIRKSPTTRRWIVSSFPTLAPDPYGQRCFLHLFFSPHQLARGHMHQPRTRANQPRNDEDAANAISAAAQDFVRRLRGEKAPLASLSTTGPVTLFSSTPSVGSGTSTSALWPTRTVLEPWNPFNDGEALTGGGGAGGISGDGQWRREPVTPSTNTRAVDGATETAEPGGGNTGHHRHSVPPLALYPNDPPRGGRLESSGADDDGGGVPLPHRGYQPPMSLGRLYSDAVRQAESSHGAPQRHVPRHHPDDRDEEVAFHAEGHYLRSVVADVKPRAREQQHDRRALPSHSRVWPPLQHAGAAKGMDNARRRRPSGDSEFDDGAAAAAHAASLRPAWESFTAAASSSKRTESDLTPAARKKRADAQRLLQRNAAAAAIQPSGSASPNHSFRPTPSGPALAGDATAHRRRSDGPNRPSSWPPQMAARYPTAVHHGARGSRAQEDTAEPHRRGRPFEFAKPQEEEDDEDHAYRSWTPAPPPAVLLGGGGPCGRTPTPPSGRSGGAYHMAADAGGGGRYTPPASSSLAAGWGGSSYRGTAGGGGGSAAAFYIPPSSMSLAQQPPTPPSSHRAAVGPPYPPQPQGATPRTPLRSVTAPPHGRSPTAGNAPPGSFSSRPRTPPAGSIAVGSRQLANTMLSPASHTLALSGGGTSSSISSGLNLVLDLQRIVVELSQNTVRDKSEIANLEQRVRACGAFIQEQDGFITELKQLNGELATERDTLARAVNGIAWCASASSAVMALRGGDHASSLQAAVQDINRLLSSVGSQQVTISPNDFSNKSTPTPAQVVLASLLTQLKEERSVRAQMEDQYQRFASEHQRAVTNLEARVKHLSGVETVGGAEMARHQSAVAGGPSVLPMVGGPSPRRQSPRVGAAAAYGSTLLHPRPSTPSRPPLAAADVAGGSLQSGAIATDTTDTNMDAAPEMSLRPSDADRQHAPCLPSSSETVLPRSRSVDLATSVPGDVTLQSHGFATIATLRPNAVSVAPRGAVGPSRFAAAAVCADDDDDAFLASERAASLETGVVATRLSFGLHQTAGQHGTTTTPPSDGSLAPRSVLSAARLAAPVSGMAATSATPVLHASAVPSTGQLAPTSTATVHTRGLSAEEDSTVRSGVPLSSPGQAARHAALLSDMQQRALDTLKLILAGTNGP